MSQSGDHRQYRWLKTLIVVLVAIVLLLGIAYLLDMSKDMLLEMFATATIHAILIVAIVSVLYEYYTRNHFLQEMRENLEWVVISRTPNPRIFSSDKRRELIKECVGSLLSEEKGSLLYDAMISPYLDGQYGFRRRYRYDIAIDEPQKKYEYEGLSLDTGEYYIIHEHLQYAKCSENCIEPVVRIGFAYDPQTLEKWIGDDLLFFREYLCLGETGRTLFTKLSKEKIMTFLVEVMKLRVVVFNDGAEFPIEVSNIAVIHDHEGIIVECNISDCLRGTSHNELECSLRFEMPQHVSYGSRFLVTLPEPTEVQRIQFTYCESMKDVTAITFLPRVEGISIETVNRSIIISGNRWLFPRSGVVFVWERG